MGRIVRGSRVAGRTSRSYRLQRVVQNGGYDAETNVRALDEAARALPEPVKEEGEKDGNEEGYAKLE